MILKKPYAFIIKHFRAIHLLLLIPMLYLISETKEIAVFFSEYIRNGYVFNGNIVLSTLASNYINIFMYLSIILILVVFIFLSVVLQKKEKPTKFYNYSIVYYIILFFLLTASFSIFKMIETDMLDDVFARMLRDFGYIVHYSQYFFLIYTLVRGIGFNIKKFNFKSDLQDLEISNEDSEEFEFLVGIDTYKTKRTIRRFFRELKYYYKENKFIFVVIVVVILSILTTSLYMNKEAYKSNYQLNEKIAFGYLVFNIKEAYISNLSQNGQVINSDKSYVIMQIEIENRYRENKEFNYHDLALVINKSYVYPNITLGNYFSDYGNPYNGLTIKGNTTATYVLVYEIDKYLINSKMRIEAYSGYDTTPGGLGLMTKNIKLKPIILNSKVNTNIINVGTKINLNNTNLKDTKVTITDYKLANRHEFEVCNNNICSNDVVYINYQTDNGKTLLIMDYDLELDNTSTYMYSNKNYKNFFEDFMKIKYKIGSKVYYKDVKLVNPINYSKELILKVPSDINMASSIEAVITVRNVSYSIKLK